MTRSAALPKSFAFPRDVPPNLCTIIASSGSQLDSVERLTEVGDQVLGIVDSDRMAHQVVLETGPAPFVGVQGEKRRRLLDDTLHAAQGGADVGDAQKIHETRGSVHVAIHLEAHHTSETGHLAARQ